MKSTISVSLFAAIFCAAMSFADEPKAPAPKAVPVPVPAAKTSDEIPFTDFDDSADAAKARPEVKLAPLPESATDEKEHAIGQTNVSYGVDQSANRQTGAQIAAKYLFGDELALVDITSDDATISDILRQFRKTTGANIIYAESTNLQQRVSINLKRVPWLEAMSSILSSRGFRVESSGGIHFVKEDKVVVPTFTRTFLLNHASADELAKLFNETYGVVKDGKVIKKVATPFQGANTVVVTADERTLADCEKIVKSVDKTVPQIYIEARFIELSNEAMHKLGVQWNQLESWGASVKDLSAGMGYANGRTGKYKNGYSDVYYTPKKMVQTGVTTSETKSEAAGQTGVSSSKNITYTDLASGKSELDHRLTEYLRPSTLSEGMEWRNYRTFSGQLSADDFAIAMSAFEQLEDTKIFSNPRIIVSNGKEALFDRTTKFPHITLTSQHDTQSGYTKSDAKLEVIPGEDELFSKKKTAFFSWGITLTVKPRISPDGLISVEIVPSISEPDKSVTSDGFYHISGGTDAPYGSYPILLFKRLTTEFTMKDGSTAVIGGLSKTEEGDIDSGIPYLRKIPWIGDKLFGWKSRGKVQKEILIFVTVGIADPANLPEDIGLPKNAVRGREYVEKRAFEPGDRPNAANKLLNLDMRSLEDQQRAAVQKDEAVGGDDGERGTVTITLSQP